MGTWKMDEIVYSPQHTTPHFSSRFSSTARSLFQGQKSRQGTPPGGRCLSEASRPQKDKSGMVSLTQGMKTAQPANRSEKGRHWLGKGEIKSPSCPSPLLPSLSLSFGALRLATNGGEGRAAGIGRGPLCQRSLEAITLDKKALLLW